MTTSNIETTLKVNYPMGFCDFSCSRKKKFVDRDNLLNTKVVGLEDALDTIDCHLSVWYLNTIACFTPYFIEHHDCNDLHLGHHYRGCRCHPPFHRHLQVVQSLDGLLFPCLCMSIYKNIYIKFKHWNQFSFLGVNASRMRGLKVTVDNWNREVGRSQGVSLALGVDQRIVGTWAFTRAMDTQWICSCFGRQLNLHICRDIIN